MIGGFYTSAASIRNNSILKDKPDHQQLLREVAASLDSKSAEFSNEVGLRILTECQDDTARCSRYIEELAKTPDNRNLALDRVVELKSKLAVKTAVKTPAPCRYFTSLTPLGHPMRQFDCC